MVSEKIISKEVISEKRIIIADVDGTVCESCQPLSTEMAAAINQLLQKGYLFAFISGTKKEYLLEMVSSQLSNKHYLLPTTGTQCLEIQSKNNYEELYKHSLISSEKNEIIAALENITQQFKIESLTTKEDQIQDRETQITLSAIGRSAPKDKKECYDPDGGKRSEWIRHLKTILDEQKYEITIAGTTSIDITKKGLDKGWGITQFAQKLGLPLSSILFLGDKTQSGENDYPATKVVDFITVRNPAHTLMILKKIVSDINKL